MGMHFVDVKHAQKNGFKLKKNFFIIFGNLQFLGLQKVSLKSIKNYERLFSWRQEPYKCMFGVNISSYGHEQRDLTKF